MNCAARSLRSTSPAARGFFSTFYEWSVVNQLVRPLHTTNALANIGKHASVNGKHIVFGLEAEAAALQSTSSSLSPTHDAISNSRSRPKSINTSSSEPPLSTQLRILMRSIPHSVVVATSTSPALPHSIPKSKSNGQDKEATSAPIPTPTSRGMTVSSFTTLTLTPDPIVTFNIRAPSSTLDAITASGRFHIHILAATSAGARIADTFSKGFGKADSAPATRADGAIPADPRELLFHKSALHGGRVEDELAPPLLAAKGITRVLKCEVWPFAPEWGLARVGDHVLVFGKVVGIVEGQPASQGGMGLCYAEGQYRAVHHPIDIQRTDEEGEAE